MKLQMEEHVYRKEYGENGVVIYFDFFINISSTIRRMITKSTILFLLSTYIAASEVIQQTNLQKESTKHKYFM